MKRFKNIYAFEAFSKLTEGKTVCVCDRQYQSCDTLNELTVEKVVAIINDAAEHKDRYDFWIEEEIKEEKEKDVE